MKYLAQKFVVAVVSIQIAFPNLSFAVNEQSKISLSDEQAFIARVENKFYEIAPGKNKNWKTTTSGNLYLIVNGYGPKKESVLFVATPNPKVSGEFFLIANRIVNGKWKPRYGLGKSGGQMAIGAFNSKGFRTFYINQLNVADVMKNSGYAINDDRDAQIEMIKATAQKILPNKDIKHRELAEQILNISSESKAVPLVSLPKVDETMVDVDGLGKKMAEYILRGAIQGRVALGETFDGKFTKDQWKKFFNNSSNGFSEETIQSPVYQKILTEELNKSLIIGSDVYVNDATELENFNKEVKKIQDTCSIVQAEHNKNQKTLGETPTVNENSSVDAMNNYSNFVSAKLQITNAQREIANAGAKAPLDYITETSPLAVLWAAENFENKVGHFTPESCVDLGRKVDIHPINITDVTWGMKTVKEKFSEVANKTTFAIGAPYGKMGSGKIKKMLRSAPISSQAALSERRVVQEFNYVANSIRDIYTTDQFNQVLDYTLMGVGFASGVILAFASGGTLAAPIAGVMYATDAVSLMRGANQAYSAYRLDGALRGAMVAGQVEKKKGQEELRKTAQDKKAGMTTALATIGGNAAGFAIGKSIQGSTKAKSIASTEQTTTQSVKTEAAAPVKNISESEENLPLSIAAGRIKGDVNTKVIQSGIGQHDWHVSLNEHSIPGMRDSDPIAKLYTIEVKSVHDDIENIIMRENLISPTGLADSSNGPFIIHETEFNRYYEINFKENNIADIELLEDWNFIKSRTNVDFIEDRFKLLGSQNNANVHYFDHKNNVVIRDIKGANSHQSIVISSDGKSLGIEEFHLELRNKSLHGDKVDTHYTDNMTPKAKIDELTSMHDEIDHPEYVKAIYNSKRIEVSAVGPRYVIRTDNAIFLVNPRYGRIALGKLENGHYRFVFDKTETFDHIYISNHLTHEMPVETIYIHPNEIPRGFSGVSVGWHTGDAYESVKRIEDIMKQELPSGCALGGSLNCTGNAQTMDLFLNGQASASALPDQNVLYPFLQRNTTNEGKTISPTLYSRPLPRVSPVSVGTFRNAEEAAQIYGSKVETFESKSQMYERFNQLPEGTTAIIFHQNEALQVTTANGIANPPSNIYHVFNMKKYSSEGLTKYESPIVYFDAQDGLVSQDLNVMLQTNQYNTFTETKIVITNQHHIDEAQKLDQMPLVPVNQIEKKK